MELIFYAFVCDFEVLATRSQHLSHFVILFLPVGFIFWSPNSLLSAHAQTLTLQVAKIPAIYFTLL